MLRDDPEAEVSDVPVICAATEAVVVAMGAVVTLAA